MVAIKMISGANLGCGPNPTAGWLNFDNSLSVRFSRRPFFLSILKRLGVIGEESLRVAAVARDKGIIWADACKRIPVSDRSLDVVYSSHVIEHLDLQQAALFLAEIRRVLKPEGIIRLAVPDLKRRIDAYCQSSDADEFMKSLTIQSTNPHSLPERMRLLVTGDRNHRWMYDSTSLVRLVENAGFVAAIEMPPGETMIPEHGLLNLREREQDSIYVEARR